MFKMFLQMGFVLLTLCSLVSFGAAQPCLKPPPDMTGWWPGDGDADDIINGNPGALQGGAMFAAGQVGQAFFLDGIDDFVNLGNAPNLRVSGGNFTVDAWVRFNALSHPPGANIGNAPQGDMSIVDKMSVNGVNIDGWRLLKQDDNRFWFCLGGGAFGNRCGNSSHTVFSTTVAVTGVWFHVAAVKSSSSFSIYVNGVLEDSRSPVPAFLDTHSANLRIGSYILEGAHLNGEVDEVEIYNRALTPTEIAGIFAAGSTGKCRCLARLGGFRSPTVEQVTKYPNCGLPTGIFGVLRPKWGRFEFNEVLEADSGEQLHLECQAATQTLRLFYTSPAGQQSLVGVCPFKSGCNTIWFIHTGDHDNNGKPDCFIRTAWRSQDYGSNDVLPNPWTRENPETPPLLDWAEMTFDAERLFITKLSVKWTYNVNPPLDLCTFCDTPPQRPEGRLASIRSVDPPLGPETEAFFAEVLDTLQTLPADAPTGENPSALCDLNQDGHCDATDFQLLQGALGKCLEDFLTPADVRADVDGDGCVTPDDQEILVSSDFDNDGVLGFDDACPLSDLSITVVIDSCDSKVSNTLRSNGCTISDLIAACARGARNHGQFVSCVSSLTNDLNQAGTITGQQQGAIQRCAAQADIP
jgi:hypothetical protein